MSGIGRKAITLGLAEILLLLAVHALSPFLISGSERYLLAGTAAGLALAVLWPWSDRHLLIATEVLAIGLALGLQALPHGDTRGLSAAATVGTRVVTLAPAGALALTVATVCLASLCGWLLYARRTPWPVVALAGSMMLVRADVSRVYEDRFPLFLAAALALVMCVYSPSLRRLWLAIPGVILSLLLLAATWRLPAAPRSLSLSWLDSLSGLKPVSISVAGQDSLSLEGPFRPSDQPVMAISITRPDLKPYWRMTVYDRYDGHGWTATSDQERLVPARTLLGGDGGFGNRMILARVHLLAPATALVSVGEPIEASIPAIAVTLPGGIGPAQLQSPDVLAAGSAYEVAGNLAPSPIYSTQEWSADLRLPPEPARVAALARSLTATARGALARALAIDAYLRQSGRFTYDVNAGSPADGDAVDDFLFNSRKGYCDQFASAMVVLARSVGIPARLIVGYATGSSRAGTFLVRQRDAHSWAEVFTPLGWVALDPTPGFEAAPTPSAGVTLPPAKPSQRTPRTGTQHGLRPPKQHLPPEPSRSVPSTDRSGAPASPTLIGGIAAAIVLTLGLTYAFRRRSLDEMYRGAVRGAPRRYGRLDPAETPLEFAERFRGAPEEYADMQLLAGLYARSRYAGRGPDAAELEDARRAWKRLRLHRLRHWLGRGAVGQY